MAKITIGNLDVPTEATQASLLIRHSKAISTGYTRTCTLSAEGIELCSNVRYFYTELVKLLSTRFGLAEIWSSEHIRSTITAWEILHPEQIGRTELLNVRGDLPGFGWFVQQKAKGRTTVELIAEFVQTKWLLAPDLTDFTDALMNYREFALPEPSDAKLRIGVCHEVGISMLAHELELPSDELGMAECQSVVIFLNDSTEVVGIEKITPAATLAA